MVALEWVVTQGSQDRHRLSPGLRGHRQAVCCEAVPGPRVAGRPPRGAALGGRRLATSRANVAAGRPRANVAAAQSRAEVAGRTFLWRRVLLASALLAAAALAWEGTSRLLPAGAQPAHAAPLTYVARPGDTIWGIAERYARGGDPWPLVDRLEDEIGGATLQPGQVLTVP
ncbi:MAG TPA: LysM domain-containing protein [Acidimicrobiales bacterium]|nr:LysM domain-containing protein [Acidimicrobiales bacterium]